MLEKTRNCDNNWHLKASWLFFVLCFFHISAPGAKKVQVELVQPSMCQSILNGYQLTVEHLLDLFHYSPETIRSEMIGPGIWLKTAPDLKNNSFQFEIRMNPKYQMHLKEDRFEFYAWGPPEENEELHFLNSDLSKFDQFYSKLGFEIPRSTTVILGNKARISAGTPSNPVSILDVIFPFHEESNIEPHALENRTAMAVWDDKEKNYLVIRWAPLDLSNINRSMLMHERFHILSGRSFPRSSIINNHLVLQEAIADFGAALYFNSPIIEGIRDLSSAPDLKGKKFDELHEHPKSLLFSNVLWQMKTLIGRRAMIRSFKPFLETLNRDLKKESAEEVENGRGLLRQLRQFTEILIEHIEQNHGRLSNSKKEQLLEGLMQPKEVSL